MDLKPQLTALAFLQLLFTLRSVEAFGIHASDRRSRQTTSSVVLYSAPTLVTKDERYQPLKKQGGIVYRTSVFNKSELFIIRKDLKEYNGRLKDEISSSVAQERRGAVLTASPQVLDILRQGSLVQFVRSITGNPNYVLRDQEVPVEIRSYEKRGASMAWHRDDILFDPPQIEVVWTLENSSDCRTMWKIQCDNVNNNPNQPASTVHSVETDPNAALLIPAGGVEHCVSSLKQGRRVILKCVYALDSATFLTGSHLNQFGGGGTGKKKKKRNQGKRQKR